MSNKYKDCERFYCISVCVCVCVVSSSRYDGQSSGAIEVISPASSPAQREEKNERSFSSEKNTQPATGEALESWRSRCTLIQYTARQCITDATLFRQICLWLEKKEMDKKLSLPFFSAQLSYPQRIWYRSLQAAVGIGTHDSPTATYTNSSCHDPGWPHLGNPINSNIVWRSFVLTVHFWEQEVKLCIFVMQHIITQDFAKNQDPPSSSSSSTSSSISSTFQNSGAAGSSARSKVPNRYSPENPVNPTHHQKPASRVSPENASEKSRSR